MAIAPTISVLMLGRFISGLGIGVASQIVNIYLSELAPKQIRGAVVSSYNVGIDIGLVCSLLISLACDRDWRLMLGLGALPALAQLICLYFVPETQRWLAKKDRFHECEEVLNMVYEE